MAKKQKSKLNTDLDESLKDLHSDDDIQEDDLPVIAQDEGEGNEEADDSIYTMGEIVVEENADENDDLRILQTGIKATKKEEADDDDDSGDEEYDWEVDLDGSDPFLDDDDYDPEEDNYE